MKFTRQRILVIVLSLVALAVFMPAATKGWQTHGSFGMRIVRGEDLVREVEPRSPAAQAGIVPGDHVDVAALGIPGHLRLIYPNPGDRLNFKIQHGDQTRSVTLTAGPRDIPDVVRWLTVLDFLSTAAFIIVGTILVFFRAAPMTWWLWAYCIGIVPVTELLDYYSFLPDDVFAVVWLAGRTLLGGFSVFPLLPFVLRFPHDKISGWRERIRTPSIALVVTIFFYYVVISWIGLRYGIDEYSRLNGIPALVMYVAAATILIATYVQAHGSERQRLKWAVVGMIITFAAQITNYIPGPVLLPPLAQIVSIVMPISVAYAALRHRLIDVEFVVNRAIIYGVLTALLLSFVSLIDWLTSHYISEYHLALYAEAGATIAIGFALDRLHGGLENITDRFFFRSRHIAEQQLERVAKSLVFATRLESIEEALIDEPARWLSLASATIFRHDDESGTFVRGHSIGWNEDELSSFADDAPIARYLHADRKAITAGAAAWHVRDLPGGANAPALYIPIFSRNRLHAIAVYGAHVNSALPDPGEAGMLERLAPEAGAAFDHLALDALTRELAGLTGRGTVPLGERITG